MSSMQATLKAQSSLVEFVEVVYLSILLFRYSQFLGETLSNIFLV